MQNDEYKPKSFASFSREVQLHWTMGNLAKYLGTTKKVIRKANNYLEREEFTDYIQVKGSIQKLLFIYGYHSFYKQEKTKRRFILAPHPSVQILLREISDKIIQIGKPHHKAFGFVRGRNFQMAARTLLGNKHFFSFDIANAFPSITESFVVDALKTNKVPEELVDPIAHYTTYNYDHQKRTPTGASSSPAILNMVFAPMCREINRYCIKHNISWFVYADDFNFASDNISNTDKEALLSIPPKYGFLVKPEKTTDNNGNSIPHFLGLTVVDNRIHLRRRTKNKFRRIMYQAWKFDAYNPKQVGGVVAVIKQVYGKKRKYWPGMLRKMFEQYQIKQWKEKKRNEKRKIQSTR